MKYSPYKILIDTGASGSYTNHKLIKNLICHRLEEPYQYIKFNREIQDIDIAVETSIRLKEVKIPIRLLVGNEEFNDFRNYATK